MAAEGRDMSKRETKTAGTTPTRHENYFLVPPADIFEDQEGITVQAEMPGVSKERLNIHADRNNLVIEGEATIDVPAGTEAIHAELQSTK